MNGHAPSNRSLTYEENMVLLDEKSPSDIESEAGRADLTSRFFLPSSSSCSDHDHGPPSPRPPRPSRPSFPSPRSLLLRTLIFLLPSFLQPASSTTPRRSRPNLHETSYLDGLRGLAALFVFFCHYSYTCFVIAHGYGYEPRYSPPEEEQEGGGVGGGDDNDGWWNYHPPTNPTPNNHALLKLPFARLFYSGPPMVCVFFVISGYALSLRPIILSRAKKFGSLSATLSSLVFRRAVRLFLPCAISTLLIVLLVRIGAYEWTREFAYDERYLRNVQEVHYLPSPPPPAPTRTTVATVLTTTTTTMTTAMTTAMTKTMTTTVTAATMTPGLATGVATAITTPYHLTDLLAEWLKMQFRFLHVWDWTSFGGSTSIDVHLWTIPVEFRASMVLFLSALGLARLKTGWRFVLIFGLALFCYRSKRWEMVLFYWGFALAEMDVARGAVAGVQQAHEPRRGGALVGAEREKEEGKDDDDDEEEEEEEKQKKKNKHGKNGKRRCVGGGWGRGWGWGGRRRQRRSWSSWPSWSSWWWMGVSLLGLYFMSQPDYGSEETPGWIFLTGLIPDWWERGESYRFWQSAGAMLFVLAVGRCRGWQRVFESRVVQYFGKISYAVYLMHGPVLHTVGYAIERWVWTRITGIETLRAYNTGFVLASVFVVPIVIWVSDVFWRAVDAPVVKFARWLERVCSISE